VVRAAGSSAGVLDQEICGAIVIGRALS